MADLTKLLTKISNGSKFRLSIIKNYAWDNRKDKLTFNIELLKAITDEKGDSIDLKFLISNLFINGNRTTKRDFEVLFNTWDIQEDLREKLKELYKLDRLGFYDLYMIGTEFII